MTREEIERLNESEPYCFETDREEQWYRIGLIEGLKVADNNPKPPCVNMKYRPFESKEECWNEMSKHQPFGWVRTKAGNNYAIIGSINEYTGVDITFATNENLRFTTEFLFEKYTFADGTPFGIKEE